MTQIITKISAIHGVNIVLSHLFFLNYFCKFNLKYIKNIYSESSFKKTHIKIELKYFNMPKITSIETETDVKRLSKENYSKTDIKNKLKEEDIDISIKIITRILKNVGIRMNI